MFRYRAGTAGSGAGGAAAARYFLSETLRPENDLLAKYYAGESVPEVENGIDALGRSIADGTISYGEALSELVLAHTKMFGWPEDDLGLEERIGAMLLDAATRADMRDAVAEAGGTVARVREDLDPRLAKRLEIDTKRQLTQTELARLLSGLKADGEAIEGKQIQKPMRSIAEVFGLDARRLPTPAEIDHVLAGRRADGEAPRSAKGNGEPLAEAVVQGARKRFLAAYELPSNTELTSEHIEQMKAGRTATGRFLDQGAVLRKLEAMKSPLSYVDCIWSAEKSVTVAWALAPTEAERSLIQQAHRDAVAFSMAYVEQHLGFTTKGKGGKDGIERGTTAWVLAEHYTSRPTAEIATVDPKTGEAYTEFQTIPMKVADPQLHSHALLLNAVLTADGRIGSMDLDLLDGLVKELGGIYQARLARNLRASGINAVLDPKTGAARILDVPTYAAEHFSKRTRDINAAARGYAVAEGLDWDAMTPAHQLKFLRKGVEETRQPKREHDGDSDFTVWRKQAADEIGYQHRSVLRPGQEQGLRPEAERHRRAYEVSLPLIEEALSKKAKLGAGEFREFAARGFIEAGIGDDPARDIKAVMRMYREHGVRQNGEMTRILIGKDVPVRGKDRWSVTTAMHIDEERLVVGLAAKFGNDLSGALTPAALERASKAFLVSHPKIDPNGAQWLKQREVIERAGTGPMFNVIEGVGGAGKSTILSPLVAASREAGSHVYGIARGWKQAVSLSEAGLTQRDVAATSVFLDRVSKGRITLDAKSTVIVEELSQVGRGDMLNLLKLQAKHGFRMLAVGDPKQGGSVDPEVMSLLLETLGDKVPQILTSVRQNTEREREISRLFRDGHAGEAIAIKIEDRTAELVAGGRAPTIERIAAKWTELTDADPTLHPTIGTASNRDAHDIGVAIRRKLQEAGKVGTDKIEIEVLQRGETGVHKLPLAEGDKVRVFNRVWVDGHLASNGDVLEVLKVSDKGMEASNGAGRAAFVPWNKLRSLYEDTPRLAYGHALTIDASQGTTSRVHIDAVLSGSWMQQGGKGYVNESRQVETTHLIVNEAAERRKIYSRFARGEEHPPIRAADVWKHVADNLSRPAVKASALDFMRDMTGIRRGGLAALPATLEPAERRERAGEERTTIRYRIERLGAEIAPAIRRVMGIAQPVQQQVPRRANEQSRGPSLGI